MIYCVVPRDIAPRLYEPLRRHFSADPSVEVIVERRGNERRRGVERRRGAARDAVDAVIDERRLINNETGRRVSQQRAALVPVEAPPLPRRARAFAERLIFVEVLGETSQQAEDATSDRLVTHFQAGEQEAFAELYMLYFDRVYGYLALLFGKPEEAEDVTQQVFVRVLDALPRYEPRPRVPFRAWLFTVVRNHAISELRKRRRVLLEEPSEIDRRREAAAPPADAELEALNWISDRELLLFIQRLPLSQQQVLVLRYMLDLSTSQVAVVLGRTPNQVKLLQHRAHSVLRQRMAALGRAPKYGRRLKSSTRPSQAIVLRERRFALVS
jgi:RNA polymerase sigma-70 factor (ECF subfamily)